MPTLIRFPTLHAAVTSPSSTGTATVARRALFCHELLSTLILSFRRKLAGENERLDSAGEEIGEGYFEPAWRRQTSAVSHRELRGMLKSSLFARVNTHQNNLNWKLICQPFEWLHRDNFISIQIKIKFQFTRYNNFCWSALSFVEKNSLLSFEFFFVKILIWMNAHWL